MKLYLRVLLTPSVWKNTHTISPHWDKLVRELILEGADITEVTGKGGRGVTYREGYKLGDFHISLQDYNWDEFGSTTGETDIFPANRGIKRTTKLMLFDYLEAYTERLYNAKYTALFKGLK